MSDNGRTPDKPVFDYSNYSRREQKELTKLQLRIQRLSEQVSNAGQMDDDTFEAKMGELDEMLATMENIVSQRIVSLPRDWLVPGAPEAIDWQQPGALDWIRADRLTELQNAAVEARTPEAVTGN